MAIKGYNLSKGIRRRIIAPAIVGLGLDKVLMHFSKMDVLHITYHGVVKEDSTYFSARHITLEQFEKQLIYFKKHFDILPTSQAISQKAQSTDRKVISISFDDGFENNLTTVLPLLEKYNIPVTFCISSICTNDKKDQYLWSEAIAALEYFHGDEKIEVGGLEFQNMHSVKDKKSMYAHFKSLEPEVRDNQIDDLIERYDIDTKLKSLPTEIWRLMDRNQLIELSQSDQVEIGSHGHLHYNLGEISLADARAELLKSKKLLEATIGKEVEVLAYPDGSYTDEVKNIAEEVGYKYQLAVNYLNYADRQDQRIVNRHGISSTTTYASNIASLSMAFSKKGSQLYV